jgi:ppGpp synthetase/RelA/SpoT-type nucleotidyltranferase
MSKAKAGPTKAEATMLDGLVAHYVNEKHRFELFAKSLHDSIMSRKDLRDRIQFAKFRVKDPDHLRDKLQRKLQEAKDKKRVFRITKDNLFSKIWDLAGVRLLHLHTQQMEEINPLIRLLVREEKYKLLEPPTANLWDHEYESFFKRIRLRTDVRSDSMYTSVHYIIQNQNEFHTTCELQVRTLSEELWGEVSHTINYPEKTDSVACQEQLKVLARVTSSATRLVDAIFKSHKDHNHL